MTIINMFTMAKHVGILDALLLQITAFELLIF